MHPRAIVVSIVCHYFIYFVNLMIILVYFCLGNSNLSRSNEMFLIILFIINAIGQFWINFLMSDYVHFMLSSIYIIFLKTEDKSLLNTKEAKESKKATLRYDRFVFIIKIIQENFLLEIEISSNKYYHIIADFILELFVMALPSYRL